MELRKAVDNLCLYDPQYKAYADKFVGEMGGSSAIQAVSSIECLKDAVNNYIHVKFLEVVLHGRPGSLDLPDGNNVEGTYIGTLAQNTPFLQKNARVLFDSCNIGEGDRGDGFMDALGKKLFTGKGGIIGATTVATWILFPKSSFCMGWFMKPLSFGRLKVRRYDDNGNNISELITDRHGIKRAK